MNYKYDTRDTKNIRIGGVGINKVLERIRKQIDKHKDDENVIVDRYDLMNLVQEYEFETRRKKRWNDERW